MVSARLSLSLSLCLCLCLSVCLSVCLSLFPLPISVSLFSLSSSPCPSLSVSLFPSPSLHQSIDPPITTPPLIFGPSFQVPNPARWQETPTSSTSSVTIHLCQCPVLTVWPDSGSTTSSAKLGKINAPCTEFLTLHRRDATWRTTHQK